MHSLSIVSCEVADRCIALPQACCRGNMTDSRTASVTVAYLGLLSLLCLEPGCLLPVHLAHLFLCLCQQSRPDGHHKRRQSLRHDACKTHLNSFDNSLRLVNQVCSMIGSWSFCFATQNSLPVFQSSLCCSHFSCKRLDACFVQPDGCFWLVWHFQLCCNSFHCIPAWLHRK